MEFIAKSELIDKIYALNGSSYEKVDNVYFYEDDEYFLRLKTVWDSWRIYLIGKAEGSIIIETNYTKDIEQTHRIKITKKDAKNIADFVFLSWNSRK